MTALSLKFLACVLMLCDHVGYLTGNIYLRIPGRLAFPIFAFMIANGFRHTHSKVRYGLRLTVCAVLSEPAFDRFCYGKWFYPDGQNVLWTLLLGFLCLWAYEMLCSARLKWLYPAVLTAACVIAVAMATDYSYIGVLTVAVFGIGGKNAEKPKNAVSLLSFGLFIAVSVWKPVSYLIAAAIFEMTGVGLYELPVFSYVFQSEISRWDLVSLFRIAALVPLFLYNGERGRLPPAFPSWLLKASQSAFYLFYPAHMLLLSFLLR